VKQKDVCKTTVIKLEKNGKRINIDYVGPSSKTAQGNKYLLLMKRVDLDGQNQQ
jgi:hypothetical protein